MSKKPPPRRDIDRARRLLTSGEQDQSADIAWARQILAGTFQPAPGDALRPEIAYALVEQLIEQKQADSLAQLAKSEHRVVVKAARTGLHRLRSHKVEVEVPVDAEQPHAGTGLAERQQLRSMLTVYDSRWERLAWMAEESPGSVTVYQARLSASFGLVELLTGKSSRKEYRAKTRQVLDDLGGEMVDSEETRWLLHEGARRCEESGRSLPRGFIMASQALGPAPKGEHPALVLTPATGADLLPLYDLAELRYWYPDREFLQRVALRIEEAGTSRLVLSDVQKQQRIGDILDRAVEEFFTAQRCAACRTLLLDTAHLLMVRGNEETAAALRAAADRFNNEPERVAADPFARHLVERVLGDRATNRGASPEQGEPPDSNASPGGGLILP